MSFFPDWFGKAPIASTIQQEAEANAIAPHREAVLDHLETAVVDRAGRRFKEREIRTAIKTVARL